MQERKKKLRAIKGVIFPNALQKRILEDAFIDVNFTRKILRGDWEATGFDIGLKWRSRYNHVSESYPFLERTPAKARGAEEGYLEASVKAGFSKGNRARMPRLPRHRRNSVTYRSDMKVTKTSLRLVLSPNQRAWMKERGFDAASAATMRANFNMELPPDAVVKRVTVCKSPDGRFTAAVTYETAFEEVKPVELKGVLGIDFSCKEHSVRSDGVITPFPNPHKGAEKRVALLQKRMSGKKRYSRCYERLRRQKAALQARSRNRLQDFANKETTRIANAFDAVCVESLDLKGMGSSKGRYRLGKTVNQKAFGMFSTLLERKLQERGKELIKAEWDFPSSQTCNVCGHRLQGDAKLTLGVRAWTCPRCETEHDRDMNAALNLRNYGIRHIAHRYTGTCTGVAKATPGETSAFGGASPVNIDGKAIKSLVSAKSHAPGNAGCIQRRSRFSKRE